MSFSCRNEDGVQNGAVGCDDASRAVHFIDSGSRPFGDASDRSEVPLPLPVDELRAHLEQALRHVWSTVARVPYRLAEDRNADASSDRDGCRASVELAGDLAAQVTVDAEAQLARYLTEQFLSGIETDIDGHTSDTLREIANLIGGTLKSRLEAVGLQLTLSIPVSDQADAIALCAEGERDTLELKALSQYGRLTVSLSCLHRTCPPRR